MKHCTRDLISFLPKKKLGCTGAACLDDMVINCLLGLQLCICKARGYKPRITELRYFYILVRSKGYELDGVRRTIDSKLNRYPYPSFILIQLGSNDLGITKNARFDKQYRMWLITSYGASSKCQNHLKWNFTEYVLTLRLWR